MECIFISMAQQVCPEQTCRTFTEEGKREDQRRETKNRKEKEGRKDRVEEEMPGFIASEA